MTVAAGTPGIAGPAGSGRTGPSDPDPDPNRGAGAAPSTVATSSALPHRLPADANLTGAAWCRAQSDLVDRWLTQLLAEATTAPGRAPAGTPQVALVAVGGYGRQELCPQSDIDVMLVHDRRANLDQVAKIADRIWYPIWDEGFHLGHSVCTIRQALSLADDTLETATALLSARHLAGDSGLTEQLAAGARQDWEKRASRWLEALAASVEARHERLGEAAFLLEPDLKEARGGLRDVHALGWAQKARSILLEFDEAPLAEAYAVLLDARVALQRRTGRAGNVLVLQEQDGVAEALGLAGGDALMAGIADAARRIAWTSDDTWRRVASTLRGPLARGARPRLLAADVLLSDGEVTLTPDAAPSEDQTLALRTAVAAARHRSPIERHSLERLAATSPPLAAPWPAEALRLFVELLLAGHPAIEVIEALDHRGVWARIVPEWSTVRSRPQHNAYHRFTVDRHLLETAANAAGLADRVGRPDLLVLGALLHDMGKGHPGDHSLVGVGLARGVATRMGLPAEDVATLESLVRHHLLLADVASRRDLDDPLTIQRVADEVATVERLHLLGALTEADSLATGPSAWSPWKAGLVAELVERVEAALTSSDGSLGRAGAARPVGPEGRPTTPLPRGGEGFPTAGHLALLAQPGRHIDGRGDVLTVVTGDRPGVFSRVAGVVALSGLDVVAASAYSTDDGRALAEFRVVDPVRGAVPWPRVIADLELALDGRLAVSARLAERRRTYDRPGLMVRRPAGAFGPGMGGGAGGGGASAVGGAGAGGGTGGGAGTGGSVGAGRKAAVGGNAGDWTAVTVDNGASAGATVIDVHTVDRIGVLYRITRALAELDLDIRSARVQTLGPDVVDSFYVRDEQGQKITDQAHLREIERAILHALRE